jgi:TolB protein
MHLERLLRRGGYYPAWSPAGRKIAFNSGDGASLYVINATGSGERRLAGGQQPAWSPDGRRIAFTRYVGLARYGVWVINADGTGRKRLAALEAYDPVWSPTA